MSSSSFNSAKPPVVDDAPETSHTTDEVWRFLSEPMVEQREGVLALHRRVQSAQDFHGSTKQGMALQVELLDALRGITMARDLVDSPRSPSQAHGTHGGSSAKQTNKPSGSGSLPGRQRSRGSRG